MRKRVKGVIQDRPRRVWTSDKPKHDIPGPSIVSKDELVFESDVRFEGDVVGMPVVVENRWHLSNSNVTPGRRLVAKLGETGGNGTWDAISLKGTLIDHNGNFGQSVPDVIGFTVTFVPYPTDNNTYAPRFNITMDSDPGDECELELWENDLNASGGATEVYLVLNVQKNHHAYTITWNNIDGELSAVGATSPESNNYLWDSAGFAKQDCIAYKHDNHLYKYITGFDDTSFTTICHVSDANIADESDYASFIKVVLSGVVGNHVTMVEADIMVGHSYDIAVRSNSLFYGQMELRIVQEQNDKFVLQAKAVFNASASAAGNPLGLKVDITSYAGAIVEFESVGSFNMNDLAAYQVHNHTTITGQNHTSANNGTAPYKIMLGNELVKTDLADVLQRKVWRYRSHDSTTNNNAWYFGTHSNSNFDMSIVPISSDSVLEIDVNVFGETTSHNTCARVQYAVNNGTWSEMLLPTDNSGGNFGQQTHLQLGHYTDTNYDSTPHNTSTQLIFKLNEISVVAGDKISFRLYVHNGGAMYWNRSVNTIYEAAVSHFKITEYSNTNTTITECLGQICTVL